MFDGFANFDENRPWQLTNKCKPFPVDHFSCSLINAQKPYLFPGGATDGLILAASTEILCLYTEECGRGALEHARMRTQRVAQAVLL